MSRKDVFGNIKLPSLASNEEPAPHSRPLLEGGRSKPLSSVSKSLGELSEKNRRANEIEKRLAEGQAVIDLDTSQIDPSFVRDRMPGDIDGLKASISEQGQQVPILVRPHPEQPGRYQVAFGHRRLRAVQELERSVKAIVRDLTDEQLVVAQGQENNERQDLTFIEKSLFAARLRERFSRDVIVASMSVDKSDLARMLAIVDALPAELIDAIGPAPSFGRGKWFELAELVMKLKSPLDVIAYALSLAALPSDERFKTVTAKLKPERMIRGVPGVLSTSKGERLAQLKQSKTKVELLIDRKDAPDFAAFVIERLSALYEEHREKVQQDTGV